MVVWNGNHEVRTQLFRPLENVSIIKELYQFQNMVFISFDCSKAKLMF